jgi:hypothetical protein
VKERIVNFVKQYPGALLNFLTDPWLAAGILLGAGTRFVCNEGMSTTGRIVFVYALGVLFGHMVMYFYNLIKGNKKNV